MSDRVHYLIIVPIAHADALNVWVDAEWAAGAENFGVLLNPSGSDDDAATHCMCGWRLTVARSEALEAKIVELAGVDYYFAPSAALALGDALALFGVKPVAPTV